MRAADQYHVGLVVEDLDGTLEELGRLPGHEWGPEVDVEQPVRLPDGDATVRFRFRYSCTEPRIEVVEARPGTVWVPSGAGVHHLGFWSDDVDADGSALDAAGYAFEAAGIGEDGGSPWSFHRHPSGLRIELVSRAMEPLMSALWSMP